MGKVALCKRYQVFVESIHIQNIVYPFSTSRKSKTWKWRIWLQRQSIFQSFY